MSDGYSLVRQPPVECRGAFRRDRDGRRAVVTSHLALLRVSHVADAAVYRRWQEVIVDRIVRTAKRTGYDVIDIKAGPIHSPRFEHSAVRRRRHTLARQVVHPNASRSLDVLGVERRSDLNELLIDAPSPQAASSHSAVALRNVSLAVEPVWPAVS